MGVKKKERKYNREFELEILTIQKQKMRNMILMLQTTRDRIRKQGEIEQHLQKYITQ